MGDSDYIGKMVGSDAISVSGVTSGEMGIIKKLNKKEAIIWRGVIDSVGYMRLQIEKASFYKKPADMIDLGTVQLLEPMRIYSDPYDFNGQSTKTIKGDHFWINVTCNQH